MKTPEQIAFDLAQEWRGQRDHIVFTEHTLIGALREAIEADRAQRYRVTESDMDDMLSEWEDFDGDVSYFYGKWAALLSDGRQGWIENRIAELSAERERNVNYGRDEDEPYHHAADYVLSEDDWRAGLDDDEAAEIARLIEWSDER